NAVARDRHEVLNGLSQQASKQVQVSPSPGPKQEELLAPSSRGRILWLTPFLCQVKWNIASKNARRYWFWEPWLLLFPPAIARNPAIVGARFSPRSRPRRESPSQRRPGPT